MGQCVKKEDTVSLCKERSILGQGGAEGSNAAVTPLEGGKGRIGGIAFSGQGEAH